MFDTYKGDDFERAFRPYHIGTHVSSQSPGASAVEVYRVSFAVFLSRGVSRRRCCKLSQVGMRLA